MIVPDPKAVAGQRVMAAPPSILGSALLGWWRSDQGTFQDTAGTTPATVAGQSVRRINDISGNGRHMLQSGATPVPTISASTIAGGRVLAFNGAQMLTYGRIAALDNAIVNLWGCCPYPTNVSQHRSIILSNHSDAPTTFPWTSILMCSNTNNWLFGASTAGGSWGGVGQLSGNKPGACFGSWLLDGTIALNVGCQDYKTGVPKDHARGTHSGVWLGMDTLSLAPYLGDWYEAAIIVGAITQRQVRQMILYAKARYGF